MKRLITVLGTIMCLAIVAVPSASAALPGGWILKTTVPMCNTGVAHFGSNCNASADMYQKSGISDEIEMTVCAQHAQGPGGPWDSFACVTEGPGTTSLLGFDSATFKTACNTYYRTHATASVFWEGSWKPQRIDSAFIHTIC